MQCGDLNWSLQGASHLCEALLRPRQAPGEQEMLGLMPGGSGLIGR